MAIVRSFPSKPDPKLSNAALGPSAPGSHQLLHSSQHPPRDQQLLSLHVPLLGRSPRPATRISTISSRTASPATKNTRPAHRQYRERPATQSPSTRSSLSTTRSIRSTPPSLTPSAPPTGNIMSSSLLRVPLPNASSPLPEAPEAPEALLHHQHHPLCPHVISQAACCSES